MTDPILSMRNVSKVYSARRASGWGKTTVRAVDDLDLDVHEGETLAIVGESGSGKSTIAKLLLMLTEPTAGQICYEGAQLSGLNRARRSQYRRNVQAVFQDPASSLNPSMTVEQTLGCIIRRHDLVPPSGQTEFILRQLASVGLEPPSQYLRRFPHQLSGGQQQRIAIARAMMLAPKIIIADEPLSSLDVSIQAQVLELMQELKRTTNVGFVVISHDLNAMQSIADRTAVMYRGRIVEMGTDVYDNPVHDYTRLLLDARLSVDPRQGRIRTLAMAQQVLEAVADFLRYACLAGQRLEGPAQIAVRRILASRSAFSTASKKRNGVPLTMLPFCVNLPPPQNPSTSVIRWRS